MLAKQVKPGLTQPKRFMGRRKSADVIRAQPANSIRARGDKTANRGRMYGCNFYLENQNRKEGLGKRERPCMKRDKHRGGFGFSDRGVSGVLPGQYSNRRADIGEHTDLWGVTPLRVRVCQRCCPACIPAGANRPRPAQRCSVL